MIGFRQVDARFPFLWESAAQPAGRWHGDGEGPAHYLADTPDGAWAEFLRHEEITDPADLVTIRRQMWAVELGDAPKAPELADLADLAVVSALPHKVMTGGPETYPQCQAEARRLRQQGARQLHAPSAALISGGARGVSVHGGVKIAAPRDGRVIVLFGPPEGLVGWIAADAARPAEDLLKRVHHYESS